jgi:endoglucanase
MMLQVRHTRLVAGTCTLLCATVAVALQGCGGATPTTAEPPVTQLPPQNARPLPALGRGVNFGNMLEASRESRNEPRLGDDLFDRAKEAGAETIRLPVKFSAYAATTPPYRINDSILARVDYAISAADVRRLNLVIDLHHYRQLNGEPPDPGEPTVEPALVEDRFVAMWEQIAERFRGADVEHVAFELLNEPAGTMTAPRWNALLRRALAAVRRTNPTRWVVIGSVQWNSADKLAELSVPDDPRLIITIHNYDPFTFTHQGAEWIEGSRAWLGTECCSASQLAALTRPLDVAARWNTRNLPLWLGEFGAYGTGDLPSRVRFTRAVRDSAERRGMSWAYWEFAAGFGFWNPQTRAYNTALREALFGRP